MQETVIVFGGSSGIGEAAAKRLLGDGLRVKQGKKALQILLFVMGLEHGVA